ncbi:hypothetical protein [Treponema pectinovorum]|uniref:hypothetical protein n=1 Tax=Treponema pectinovorum TaxID=164 RepID=UPI001658CC7A|nr:hypothetical protein [Treponema pectinovorum]
MADGTTEVARKLVAFFCALDEAMLFVFGKSEKLISVPKMTDIKSSCVGFCYLC